MVNACTTACVSTGCWERSEFAQNVLQPRLLDKHHVQKIVTRLQGINVTSAILMAHGAGGMKLSEWMMGGLADAIHCLAVDSISDFEAIDNRAKKKADTA